MTGSSAASRGMRLWAVLSRVREMRVQRRLAELARAQRGVQAARKAVDHAVSQCERHAAQLAALQDWRTSGPDGPAMWRHARERHRQQEAALAGEAATAREALHTSLSHALTVHETLRREMHARDDARKRARKAREKARRED